MVAFLIPQAVSQFAPNPAKQVLATTYDGQTITRAEIQRGSSDLQLLRQLRLEAFPELSIIPNTGSERDDALAWILIQRAAEHNNLGASQQEAINLMATVLGMQPGESLDERAKQFNANGAYLIQLGKQYLVAEQYRQLVSGVEYELPEEDAEVRSPGLRRVVAMARAMQFIQQATQNPQQLQIEAMMRRTTPQQLMAEMLSDQGLVNDIEGHERFSAAELQYALQRQFTELDMTVVVLDAADRVESTEVDDAYTQGIFERFAKEQPGTGEPYGLGYREPDKVKLEALRIPIDAAREAVAKDISPEDVRSFYNEYRNFFDVETPEGEEPQPGPRKLTASLRDQIRLTLTEQRATELVQTIAQEARLTLNEDARGLPDDGKYKALPDDFQPTALAQVASQIEAEHGIAVELIQLDEFVSAQDIVDASRFTQAWVSKMPNATVSLPAGQFGDLMDVPVPQTILGGTAGLFTANVPALQQGQINLPEYLLAAKPFLEEEQIDQVTVALQLGLPGETLRDATGSTYVFRITEAQPSRPAQSLEPIAEAVREDAVKVKAYESLIDDKDALLLKAAELSIERLMPDAEAKNTLSGLSRDNINQQFSAAMIDGIDSPGPVLDRAFQITEDLLASGGFDGVTEKDRIFAVELPGEYKMVIARIDTFRTMTKERYEQEAGRPRSLALLKDLGASEPTEQPMSFESLQRYTGFKWADGFGPEEEDEEGDDTDSDEAVVEEDA